MLSDLPTFEESQDYSLFRQTSLETSSYYYTTVSCAVPSARSTRRGNPFHENCEPHHLNTLLTLPSPHLLPVFPFSSSPPSLRLPVRPEMRSDSSFHGRFPPRKSETETSTGTRGLLFHLYLLLEHDRRLRSPLHSTLIFSRDIVMGTWGADIRIGDVPQENHTVPKVTAAAVAATIRPRSDMAEAQHLPTVVMPSTNKRFSSGDDDDEKGGAGRGELVAMGKRRHASAAGRWSGDPAQALASARHEFGEHGGVNMSIEASATFTVMEPDTMRRMFAGELGPDRDFYIYSRHFNPTVLNLGRQMAAMEGTEAAYCTASGMSAIASVLLQVCGAGGHVVASRRLYGGTHALLAHFLPRACGIQTTFVDAGDLAAVAAAIRHGETKLLYVETVANPSLAVADVPGLCAVAHEKGVMVVVDNTFTPMVMSPARMGADVVVHSVSKFISGGADIIAGAICGPASLVNSMMDLHNGALMLLGPTMNAKVAFEISERLPHLGLRMKEHCRRAMAFAERMQKLGLRVLYPGLPSHPNHELFKSTANPGYGYGGMLCLDMGTEERANRLMNHLQNTTQFGLMAVSLGYYETLMSCSGSSTSSEMSAEEQELAGISPGLIRMSVGYSGTLEQRWAQFEKALTWIQQDGAYAKN